MSYFSEYPCCGQIVRWRDSGLLEKVKEQVTGAEVERFSLEFARSIMYALLLDTKTQVFGEHTINGHDAPLKHEGEFVIHVRRKKDEDGSVTLRAQFWFPTKEGALTR